jgi:dCTP deaminase
MILKSDAIAERLDRRIDRDKRLIIAPEPDESVLRESGSASLDLRLGTWFVELRRSRRGCLKVNPELTTPQDETGLGKVHYTRFGGEFVLHPGSFILGVTLEWIRVPRDLACFVIGKSSWGRRGLIIATATGVHPGFTGCLTLEITNVGELPIAIQPGMPICQLFFHTVHSLGGGPVDRTTYAGYRQPVIRTILMDKAARILAKGLPRDI